MLGLQGKPQPGPYVVEGLTGTLGRPGLCTDAQSQVQESDQGCRHLTSAGDGIPSRGRDSTRGHRHPEGSWGHGGPWGQSLVTAGRRGRARTHLGLQPGGLPAPPLQAWHEPHSPCRPIRKLGQ